jgi:hypothetical protein
MLHVRGLNWLTSSTLANAAADDDYVFKEKCNKSQLYEKFLLIQ